MEVFGIKEVSICLGIFCLGETTFALVIFLFIRFFKRYRTLDKEVTSLFEIESREYFADVVPKLRAWNSNAINDIAANTLPYWKRIIGRYRERGTVKSHKDPSGDQWIAYEMDIKGGNGLLDMRTSDKVLRLEVKIGYRPSAAIVIVNGRELGSMQKKKGVVLLTDSAGYDVGTYFRNKRPSKEESDGIQIQRLYSLVELIGRRLFQTCTYFMSEDMIRGNREQSRTAFIGINWTTSETEEDWLLALVGWEVLNSVGNRFRRYRFMS